MPVDYKDIISANIEDRKGLFLETSNRLNTTIQNIEKDFWVCWVLRLLFNDSSISIDKRLLFKGGTSLSKSYGLISRFSEDIDITVFRDDLGQSYDIDFLEGLGSNQRNKRLTSIKETCQVYINGDFKKELESTINAMLESCGLPLDTVTISQDENDPDGQTLLVNYPTVLDQIDEYHLPSVKIEAGAKSACDPNHPTQIKPYIADDIPDDDLTVLNITTIKAERTFWDKVIILHGQRCFYENKGDLKRNGHRVSRHYYDVYRLLENNVGGVSSEHIALAQDCARHTRMFFNSKDSNLESALPGSFRLSPLPEMEAILKKDYDAMAGMIFGDIPDWNDIVSKIKEFEQKINSVEIIKTKK
jgi:hypothetical protein